MITQTNEIITVELVTPEKAKEMLDKNICNYRKKDDRLVDRYARDMSSGRWRYQADPIKFSASDWLYDGQHRLEAVVKSNTTQKFLVIRNMPDHNVSSPSEDTGRKRTVSTHLSFNGIKRTKMKAAAAKNLISISRGVSATNFGTRPTDSEVADFVNKNNADLDEIIDHLSNRAYEAFTPSILLTALYCFSKIDKKLALNAAETISLKIPASTTDPFVAARNCGLLAKTKLRRTDAQEELTTLYKAWNLRRAGETVSQIRRSKGTKLSGFSKDMIEV